MAAATAPTTLEVDRPRARRLVAPLSTIGGLAAACAALAARDPHVKGAWGLCPSQALGFDCPGCGGLRAVNDLAHGQVVAAASSNLYLVAAMPIVIFLIARWAFDSWRGAERAPSALTTPLLVTAGIVLLAFTVLRNLPQFAWLAS